LSANSELFGQLSGNVVKFWWHWVSIPSTNRNKFHLNRLILYNYILDR